MSLPRVGSCGASLAARPARIQRLRRTSERKGRPAALRRAANDGIATALSLATPGQRESRQVSNEAVVPGGGEVPRMSFEMPKRIRTSAADSSLCRLGTFRSSHEQESPSQGVPCDGFASGAGAQKR